MPRGPKPKPTAMKRAQGNPGRRPLPENEPEPTTGIPEPPPHLSGYALDEWNHQSAELDRMGVLTRIDGAALAAYCTSYGRWVEAELKLQEQGDVIEDKKGNPTKRNPWLIVAHQAHDKMIKVAAEFGLTPSSRTRIKVVPQARGSGKKEVEEELFGKLEIA